MKNSTQSLSETDKKMTGLLMMVSLNLSHNCRYRCVCVWVRCFSSLSDGVGYVEDGREIFDDDLDDDVMESKGKYACFAALRCFVYLDVKPVFHSQGELVLKERKQRKAWRNLLWPSPTPLRASSWTAMWKDLLRYVDIFIHFHFFILTPFWFYFLHSSLRKMWIYPKMTCWEIFYKTCTLK